MTKIESAFSGVMVCPGDIWVADLVVSSGILLTVGRRFDFSSAMALCFFVAIAAWTR